MTKMLRAEMSRIGLKDRAFIGQHGIGSGKKADFVDPLSPVILQLQIISIEHSGTVHSCVSQGGKKSFEGW
jgi:hypothetical protein